MTYIILNPRKGRTGPGYDRLADNECWQWRGSRDPSGYGTAFNRRLGRVDKAHRVVWERCHGKPAPPRGSGLELHHDCRNRWCVNPHHLRPITIQENRLLRRKPQGYPKPIQHGRPGAYTNRKCRCPVCKTAWAAYMRTRRRRLKDRS